MRKQSKSHVTNATYHSTRSTSARQEEEHAKQVAALHKLSNAKQQAEAAIEKPKKAKSKSRKPAEEVKEEINFDELDD